MVNNNKQGQPLKLDLAVSPFRMSLGMPALLSVFVQQSETGLFGRKRALSARPGRVPGEGDHQSPWSGQDLALVWAWFSPEVKISP